MKIKYFVIFIICMTMLSGCKVNEDYMTIPTMTFASPSDSSGVIVGVLKFFPSDWKGRIIYAFAAPFLGDSSGDGVFILDSSVHPTTIIDQNNYFQLPTVPPGKYILVFGPTVDEGLAYRLNQTAVIFEVKSNEVLDVHEISVDR